MNLIKITVCLVMLICCVSGIGEAASSDITPNALQELGFEERLTRCGTVHEFYTVFHIGEQSLWLGVEFDLRIRGIYLYFNDMGFGEFVRLEHTSLSRLKRLCRILSGGTQCLSSSP